MMKPSESKQHFEQFVAASGRSVATLSAENAVQLMLAFYQRIRATDCPLNEDGDMILFQWGTYDFGEGKTYQYDITRQFVRSEPERDTEMSQLSLTTHFPVSDSLQALGHGNYWCPSPEQTKELEQFIREHAATAAVSILVPLRVTLAWGRV